MVNTDLIIIDEATPVSKKVWDGLLDIIMDFRWYAREPAAWVHRYQNQCRFYFGDWKDIQNAKESSKKESAEALGEVPVRDN